VSLSCPEYILNEFPGSYFNACFLPSYLSFGAFKSSCAAFGSQSPLSEQSLNPNGGGRIAPRVRMPSACPWRSEHPEPSHRELAESETANSVSDAAALCSLRQ
jgi:hypothetical protein